MKCKNYRISILKKWLCQNPTNQERLTELYKPLNNRERKLQKKYSDENLIINQ